MIKQSRSPFPWRVEARGGALVISDAMGYCVFQERTPEPGAHVRLSEEDRALIEKVLWLDSLAKAEDQRGRM